MNNDWRGEPLSPAKDKREPMTEERFYKIINMHDELIHEQKDEIARLKMKINQLKLKIKSTNGE